MSKPVIPVMHCFDDNYVIPAAVAFYSMLEQADKAYEYRFYVLHTDISEAHQQKLKDSIRCFENAELEFIHMGNRFSELFSSTSSKAHYSKEMYYKFLAPSLFPQYDKIIITDVDVVYTGDIARDFAAFDTSSDVYLAGVQAPCPPDSWLANYVETVYTDFSPEEKASLLTGAGYWIFNLRKMREDGCEQRFISFAQENAGRLRQPEQDTVNIICYPRISLLPLSAMVCTYLYDLYPEGMKELRDKYYSDEAIRHALARPVQVHYATGVKPWNTPDCTKAEIWFSYLLRTPFFAEQMGRFSSAYQMAQKSKFCCCGIPLLRFRKGAAKLLGFLPLKRSH